MTPKAKISTTLDYIVAVEKLKQKTETYLPSTPLTYLSHELIGLPGIVTHQGNPEVWLEIERLTPIRAPDPHVALKPWVKGGDVPGKSPTLAAQISVTVSPATKESPAVTEIRSIEDYPEIRQGFDFFFHELWEPWSELETVRRRSIAVYNAFHSMGHSIPQGEGAPLELVWGIGIAQWEKGSGATAKKLKYPVITQACDIVLDALTGRIYIRPQNVTAALETAALEEMDASGMQQVVAGWKAYLGSPTAPAIEANDATSFEAILRQVVAHVDGAGQYIEGAASKPLSDAREYLTVTDGWALFVRRRQSTALIQDAQRFIERIESLEDGSEPPLLRRYVEKAPTSSKSGPRPVYRGLSTSTISPEARELFFPLPYNDEQVRIIENLENSDGVVVQGPPGTGKSHTIANIISHYLSQGKSVLVTAHSQTALAVVREKLPEAIRPLSVALLPGDAKAAKDFEDSIKGISAAVAQMDTHALEKDAQRLRDTVDQLHARIHDIDTQVSQIGRSQTSERVTYRGRLLTWNELAQSIVEEAARFEWFTDRPEATLAEIAARGCDLSEERIEGLRNARARLAASLSLIDKTAPPLSALPSLDTIVKLDERLIEHAKIAKRIEGELYAIGHPGVPASDELVVRAQGLREFTLDMVVTRRIAGEDRYFVEHLGQIGDKVIEIGLEARCAEMTNLEGLRAAIEADEIDVPVDAELDEAYVLAVERFTNGESPFSWNVLADRPARAAIKVTLVNGTAPANKLAWRQVESVLEWRRDARAAKAQWDNVARQLNVPVNSAAFSVANWNSAAMTAAKLGAALKVRNHFERQWAELASGVFSRPIAKSLDCTDSAVCQKVIASVDAAIEARRLEAALHEKGALVKHIGRFDSPIANGYRVFFEKILGTGDPRLPEQWYKLGQALEHFHGLSPYFKTVRSIAEVIRAAGAPSWADAIVASHIIPALISQSDPAGVGTVFPDCIGRRI